MSLTGRRIIFRAAWVLVLVFLSGCELITFRTYRDPARGFSIMLPRSWDKADDPRAAIMVKAALENPKDKFQENINVMVNAMPAQLTLDVLVDYNKEELLRVMPNADNLREQPVYNNFLPGRMITLDSTVDGMALKIMTGVWMKNERVYVVTCIAEAKKMRTYFPIFNRVIRSLRVR